MPRALRLRLLFGVLLAVVLLLVISEVVRWT